MISTDDFKIKIQSISDRIQDSCAKAGRLTEEIKTMIVTKNHPVEVIEFAYEQGFRLFGENRIQEAREKYNLMVQQDYELHMIGHLQSNKAKLACQLCYCIQSVDKLGTVMEIEKQADKLNKVQNVMIQVNTSGESNKSGITDLDDLWGLIDHILESPNIRLTGLMTIGPFNAKEKEIRISFSKLRSIQEKIRQNYRNLSVDELSMGMSDDFHLAIEEGATLIRLGRAILGERYV